MQVARQHPAVSAIDSPRPSCSSSPRSVTGAPPSSATPTWNETRVRVDGRSKNSATAAPASAPAPSPRSRRPSARRRARAAPRARRRELFAGEEVLTTAPFKRGILCADAAPAPSPGTSFTAATARPTRRCSRWRSRLLRISERNATHLQVNRDLRREFADLIAAARLGRRPAAGMPAALVRRAGAARAAPSRTACSPRATRSRAARARRAPEPRPDRLQPRAGSNLTLVRGEMCVERRELVLRPGPHPSAGRWPSPARSATSDRLRREPARERRTGLRGGRGRGAARPPNARSSGRRDAPLSSAATSTCARARPPHLRASSSAATAATRRPRPDSLDHLLVARLRDRPPAGAWPPERREVREPRPRDPALGPRSGRGPSPASTRVMR